jgi:hypothetical protein
MHAVLSVDDEVLSSLGIRLRVLIHTCGTKALLWSSKFLD